jgi:hypothetical protein
VLIEVEIDTHDFEVLDGAQETDEGAIETVYGPGHDHIELSATGVLEHGVEARPLVPALCPTDAGVLVDLDNPPAVSWLIWFSTVCASV